jgi:hypothetical protein
MPDETVQAKATAARTWVGYANRHVATYGGKPWQYVLVPHDEIIKSATLSGLVARFNMPEIVDETGPPDRLWRGVRSADGKIAVRFRARRLRTQASYLTFSPSPPNSASAAFSIVRA